jgi:hypothetical protein
VCKRRLLRKIKERSRWCHNLRGDSFYFVAARTQHLHLRAVCVYKQLVSDDQRANTRAMLGADYAGIYTKERERLVMEQRGGKRLI